MRGKGLLHNMTGWSQFFFLCFIVFISMLIGLVITVLCVDIKSTDVSTMRIMQLIQTVFIFLLPPIVFATLCQDNPRSFLKTDTHINIKLIVLVIVLFIVIQPFIYLSNYFNQQLILPESMIGIETWMKEREVLVEKALGIFFADKSATGVISNLLIIAVVTGLAEEIFFRGCLQQIVQKIVNNKHLAIWITAIIFSAIHFQFYGFIPRMLLGAILGYLFMWSGSLWLPVIAHTIHNALNVILIQIYYGTPKYEEMENLDINNHMWIAILSAITASALLISIYRNRPIRLES